MNVFLVILGFLATSVIAGIFGAIAMEGVMFMITRARWANKNMVTALGAMLTGSRENAFRVGALVHAVAAIAFAMLYTLAMMKLGLYGFPVSLWTGIGFGILHGIFVSLLLVWIVCERHPLEEFQEAGIAIGLTHLAGHIAYGAVVGLVIGIASIL